MFIRNAGENNYQRNQKQEDRNVGSAPGEITIRKCGKKQKIQGDHRLGRKVLHFYSTEVGL